MTSLFLIPAQDHAVSCSCDFSIPERDCTIDHDQFHALRGPERLFEIGVVANILRTENA